MGKRNPRGRPRIAVEVQQLTVTVPQSVYDACCREALARDIPLAAVIREAIMYSRRMRGEYST